MIEVKDRVPTYPGRVKLTPVSGQANTYDMERADSPIEVGTPINSALFQAILEENAKFAKIASGIYDGKGGATNESNAKSITFDFEPKVVFIVQVTGATTGSTVGQHRLAAFFPGSLTATYKKYSVWFFHSNYSLNENNYAKFSNNTLTWHAGGNANMSMDNSGWKFQYIAIG